MKKLNTLSLTHTVIRLIGYIGLVSWMIAGKRFQATDFQYNDFTYFLKAITLAETKKSTISFDSTNVTNPLYCDQMCFYTIYYGSIGMWGLFAIIVIIFFILLIFGIIKSRNSVSELDSSKTKNKMEITYVKSYN